MFVVLLDFAAQRARAGALMEAHNQWLRRGFDDGVFLLAGSLDGGRGGALLAAHTTLPALRERIENDPFVVHGVVSAEVHTITPSRTDPRLAELLGTTSSRPA